MSGDPITLGIIGAGIGAITNREDPIRGAITGGVLGYGGGSLLTPAAAAGPAAVSTATGTAAQSVVPGSLKAALIEQGTLPAMTQTAGSNLVGASQLMAPAQAANMATRGLMMAQSRQTAPQTVGQGAFRGGKEISTNEPVQSLLAMAQPRRRQPMSLL